MYKKLLPLLLLLTLLLPGCIDSRALEASYQQGYQARQAQIQLQYESQEEAYERGYAKGQMDPLVAFWLSPISSVELEQFLAEDMSNLLEGNCIVKATNLFHEATARHMLCYSVYINFTCGAHAIIAFETNDLGMIFVEPSTDTVIEKLKVGDNYSTWLCFEGNCREQNYEIIQIGIFK